MTENQNELKPRGYLMEWYDGAGYSFYKFKDNAEIKMIGVEGDGFSDATITPLYTRATSPIEAKTKGQCVVDGSEDPDEHCVLDADYIGNGAEDCMYAKRLVKAGMGRGDCKYWVVKSDSDSQAERQVEAIRTEVDNFPFFGIYGRQSRVVLHNG